MALSAPPESDLVYELAGFLVAVMKCTTEINLMEQGFVLGLWIESTQSIKARKVWQQEWEAACSHPGRQEIGRDECFLSPRL